MRARGFTIIEMLVVIGILALLMGLTIGGIVAMGKTDKLLATEQLVAGMIRQARHTARSGGSPVLLEIRKGERQISGVTRVSLMQAGFDGSPRTVFTTTSKYEPIQGVTGLGAVVKSVSSGGVSYHSTPELLLSLPDKVLRRTKHNEGFYLTCTVMPPPIGAGGGGRFPLLVLGDGAINSTALGGIHLQSLSLLEQEVVQAGQNPMRPRLATWEIVGWVHNNVDPENPHQVSSLEPTHCPDGITRDEPPLHPSSTDDDVAWPMAGGAWEEIGLLYDGHDRLVLYRNGIRVGESRFAGPTILPFHTDEQVVVGRLEWETAPGVYQTTHADGAAFDDVAIFRLATADVATLPGGVEPAADVRIIAHPDGRVDVEPGPAMIFNGPFSSGAKATVTVDQDGKLTSSITP